MPIQTIMAISGTMAVSDWRWMEETERTPWYPTARLFRQKAPGDWAAVVEKVSGELREWNEKPLVCFAAQ